MQKALLLEPLQPGPLPAAGGGGAGAGGAGPEQSWLIPAAWGAWSPLGHAHPSCCLDDRASWRWVSPGLGGA